MTLESFFNKLNQNLELAKENLRIELLKKVEFLVGHIEHYSDTEIKTELEGLVDDFLSQFTSVYHEFISYIEDELPVLEKVKKPIKARAKRQRKPPKEKDFVKPTYIHKALNIDGLRLSKDARPILMDLLNKKIEQDIEKIKMQLPTYQKGNKVGEKKRITIKPEDLSAENLFKDFGPSFERELDTIPIKFDGTEYKILILLRDLETITKNKKENVIN
ncbi:MAG: hypothetical protein ACTSQI_04250 [Candidatus Helarchaeota archaeon]